MAFAQIPRPRTDAARGILLMIGTMLLFSILDACAKELTTRVGVPTTLWARYAGQTMIVFLLVLPRLGATLRTRYPLLQLLRSICLFAATFCFFNGLARIGLKRGYTSLDLRLVDVATGRVVQTVAVEGRHSRFNFGFDVFADVGRAYVPLPNVLQLFKNTPIERALQEMVGKAVDTLATGAVRGP